MSHCLNCPIAEGVHCRGDQVRIFCQKIDPSDSKYDPRYIGIVIKFSDEYVLRSSKKSIRNSVVHKPPNLATQAATAARAVGRFVGSGFKIASPADQAKRRAVCNGCEQRDTVTDRCSACGCWLPAKQRMASEGCPKGFWLPVLTTSSQINGCGGCGK